ncbi:hypothetical protein H2201_006795 [Coniosporium apollinis]|uniref:BZIP domain-containing protein n=1 Tax=Coniosporium apollinis TaxID=61459 RepID=A0ABQ9NR14_9PEZI|nr:hypothetical protein H2201_006795 [Coniosporium apollinis]
MADNTINNRASDDGVQENARSTKRRRTSGSLSSRGVANLTPEQLARKRANDREAQRAIRERTKNQIERLNNRIHELESQQPYNELQTVLRQKEAVQAENDDLRQRLASIMSIVQPVLGAQGLNDLAAAERSPMALQPPDLDRPQQHLHAPAPHPHPPPVAAMADMETTNSQAESPSAASQTSTNRHWSFPGLAPTSHVRGYAPPFDQQDQHRDSIPQDMGYPQADERLGLPFLLGSNQHHSSGALNGTSPHATAPSPGPARTSDRSALVAHSTLPLPIEATCPLDNLLIDFLAERHARAAEGASSKALVGPLYPNFSALLYPSGNVPSHPLSKVMTDILRTFPDVDSLPEQVAIVFIMFLIMRWQVEPTPENYDRLPDWITPRPSQLFTPHPAWVDHIPWPRLRDRMVHAHDAIPFDAFFIPYTTTLSLNWPYAARDVLIPASATTATHTPGTTSSFSATSPFSTAARLGSPPEQVDGNSGGEQWLINPVFETHLRELSNWSLGPAFRDAFPELAHTVKIHERR